MAVNQERLTQANEVLKIMSSYPRATQNLEFEVVNKRLFIKSKYGKMAVIPDDSRRWFRYNTSRRLGTGGTEEQTIIQLALWVTERPSMPRRILNYWFGPSTWGVSDNLEFANKLKEIGYDCNCILCGSHITELEWHTIEKQIGPACRGCSREAYRKYNA